MKIARETRDRVNTGVMKSDVNRQHVNKDFPIVRLSLKFPWLIFGKYRYISKRKSAGRCRLKSNRSECNKVRCNFQPRSVNALFLWLPQLRYSANFNVVYKWWYYLICNVYPVKQLLRRISAQFRVLHTLCLSRARDFFHQCRVSPLEKLTSSWIKTDLFPVILFLFSLIIICRWISLSYYMKLEIISLSLNSGL